MRVSIQLSLGTLLSLVGFVTITVVVGHTLSSNEATFHDDQLPTLYEYFAPEGQPISKGLEAEVDGFKLNGKLIRIISGAIHYFRVHPEQWRDRLRKLRASGANTVETYVAWNLHEAQFDIFDFGNGDNDFSIFLDVRKFIKMAQEEDLLVLLRPGPFICSEFEFGGMPSYLLRDPHMKVRTSYAPYLDRVKRYFDNLLPLVVDLQFTRGGPIIGLQIENEYGTFDTIDKSYLVFIKEQYIAHGIDALFFTSDGTYNGDKGTLPDVLKTANFQSKPESNLNDLLKIQPDKPLMVMEYWSGWFDHWQELHSKTNITEFTEVLEVILGKKYNASVNFYMFHGGTNFGFTAGANTLSTAPFYAPDVTSYDYDAPLTEAGDYTKKYQIIVEKVRLYETPTLRKPALPKESRKIAYDTIQLQKYLTFSDILNQIPSTSKFNMASRVSMEHLAMNGESGQSQGYILYRKLIEISHDDDAVMNATFSAGPVRDFGILMVNGEIQPFPKSGGKTNYWLNSVQNYTFPLSGSGKKVHTIDLLIENMGRINFGPASAFLQHKGLVGPISDPQERYHFNGTEITGIEMIALEFKGAWIKNLTNWRPVNESDTHLQAPIILQSSFEIIGEPSDTFLDMSSWTKGIAFINGFNLGRYFNAGPQKTLYVPSPFLKTGANTITIFEQLKPGREIAFSSVPKLG